MTQIQKEFFEEMVENYDDLIYRHIPKYEEMFWAIFYYLPKDFTPKKILELGCGTGNLTKLLAEKWKDSEIIALDNVSSMFDKAKAKVNSNNVKYIESSIENLNLKENDFDLVVASLSIHHLANNDKRKLFKKVFSLLSDNGYFVLADGVKGSTERLYEIDCENVNELNRRDGVTDKELAHLIDHRNKCDIYPTVEDFYNWLKEANFKNIDLLWRYSVWCVVQAQK